MTRYRLIVFLLIGWVLLVAQSAVAQDENLYAALRAGGVVGLMRHARAPGTDDPPNFRLGDCATQRNLSAEGREQAAAVGRRLREHGVETARVVASEWCRCIDTAELLGLGPVEQQADFNSLVSYPGQGSEMTRRARAWLAAQDLRAMTTLVVTHQVNIGALVGSYPQEGEIVVVRPTAEGGLEVIGTIGLD